MMRLLFFLGWMCLLASCSPERRLLRTWLPEPGQEGAPAQLRFDAYNTAQWASGPDTLAYRYDTAADTLWLMDAQGAQAYRFRASRRRLALAPPDGREWQFRAGQRTPRRLRLSHGLAMGTGGKELQWEQLLPALQSPTVELRLKNLLLAFGEGDYIAQATVARLVGLPPRGALPEHPDVALQRHFVEQLARITRRGNRFVATLREAGPVQGSLPIYERQGSGRHLRGTLELQVHPQASALVHTDFQGATVRLDGVKIGAGALLLGLPPLRIEGDWGSLFGWRFYLSR
jgi:hypothetical protein